jgi:hypothetical protein
LKRLPVHGAITMASGEHLNGSITFIPTKGQSGPSATATVEEGKYQFNRNDGPTEGPHNVVVRRVVTHEAMLKAVAAKKPNRKNGAEWTRTADVKDDGQFLQDFALQD